MNLKYLKAWNNGSTCGVSIGRFAGPFYLSLMRATGAMRGPGTFRWYSHVRIGDDTFAPIVPRRGIVRTWVIT